MSFFQHKKSAPERVKTAILTVSTTRTKETDLSGKWMIKANKKEGHLLTAYKIVPDDAYQIKQTVLGVLNDISPDAIIISGGTGIAEADVTIEAIKPLFRKELTAFGPIYAQLSFSEIESSAILSRSTAGIIDDTVVFCIPGSLNACKLACMELIFPEIGHIVKHLRTG